MTYTVKLEPMGVEMAVEEHETVLQAAFRQGITLMHGCKEGQCSACKSVLLDGEAEHGDFSTFALSESEQADGKVLLCRLYPSSDLEIELLNFDEETLANWIPAKKLLGRIAAVRDLTHDIREFDIALLEPISFYAGQYAELTVPGSGVTRSFSMANAPGTTQTLSFIIKTYPQGVFSGLLAERLQLGDEIQVEGPFGTSYRNQNHRGPTVLVGGGSGMAPLWSILNDLARSGAQQPVRLFYGARTRSDLFYLDEIAALGKTLVDFAFVPALSAPAPEDHWDGATGFIHEVVAQHYAGQGRNAQIEAYACGPPPMVEAVLPVFQQMGIDADNTHLDKFTPAKA